MIVHPSAGVAELVRHNGLTEHDAREVHAFSRFLREAPSVQEIAAGTSMGARAPGWLPYALGVGPWPDPGCGPVPVTAWNLCP